MTSLVAKNDHTSAVNEQGKPHVVQGQRKNAQATKTTLQDFWIKKLPTGKSTASSHYQQHQQKKVKQAFIQKHAGARRHREEKQARSRNLDNWTALQHSKLPQGRRRGCYKQAREPDQRRRSFPSPLFLLAAQ